MCHPRRSDRERSRRSWSDDRTAFRRPIADGGTADDEEPDDAGDDESDAEGGDDGVGGDEGDTEGGDDATDDDGSDAEGGNGDDEGDTEGGDPTGRSNVEVAEAGEAEPADPKWERPDLDDIPEFEVRADDPVAGGRGETDAGGERGGVPDDGRGGTPGEDRVGVPGGGRGGGPPTDADGTGSDPTAGMPHDARAPGATAVSSGGTEAYVAALELCARLPDDVRLPEEAADIVPAAVEAELEEDIQSFAAAEFDNPRPHVDTLSFEEIDDEVWLRIRIGVPTEGFEDVDPDEIRSFALQQLDGVL